MVWRWFRRRGRRAAAAERAEPAPAQRPAATTTAVAEPPLGPEAQWFLQHLPPQVGEGARGAAQRRDLARELAEAEVWVQAEVQEGRLEFRWRRKDIDDYVLPGEFVEAPEFWVSLRRPGQAGSRFSLPADHGAPDDRRLVQASLARLLRRALQEEQRAAEDAAYLSVRGDPVLLARAVVEKQSLPALDHLLREDTATVLGAMQSQGVERAAQALHRLLAPRDPETGEPVSFVDLEGLTRRWAVLLLLDALTETAPHTGHPVADATQDPALADLDAWLRSERRSGDGLGLPARLAGRLQEGGFLPSGGDPITRRQPQPRSAAEVLAHLTEPP